MDFKVLAYTARTCRRFVEDPRLGLADLEWLVDCARVAPCSRNAQVLRYVVAYSQHACESVFPHTRWAGAIKDWDGPLPGERPTGYIALLTPKDSGKVVHMDLGIAAQSIQLGAATRGWGCCMHASFDQKPCTAALDVPDSMVIGLLLALGVALEERVLAPMPEDGTFAYWRDAAQVHHVPKRGLGEVLLMAL